MYLTTPLHPSTVRRYGISTPETAREYVRGFAVGWAIPLDRYYYVPLVVQVCLDESAERLGSMLHPQVIGFLHHVGADGILRTCAWGAALDAAGCAPDLNAMLEEWQLLSDMTCQIPNYPGLMTLSVAISTLNDCMGWTRERIADWVEEKEREFEQQQAAQMVEQEAVCV